MNDELELQIEFNDDSTEKLLVRQIQGNLYRAEESSVSGEVYWKDEFEIEPTQEGYKFVRIAKRSGMQVYSFIIPLVVAESEELKRMLDDIVAAGGNWERIFGGCLILHVPESSKSDVGKELEQVIALVKQRQPKEPPLKRLRKLIIKNLQRMKN